jgi:hypothetical protein
VKWRVVIGYDRSTPLYEGVVAVLLTAMSLLAFLGLRYPVRLLPIPLFETLWKLIWLSVVALPALVAGDVDQAMSGDDRQLLARRRHRGRRPVAIRLEALRHCEGRSVAASAGTDVAHVIRLLPEDPGACDRGPCRLVAGGPAEPPLFVFDLACFRRSPPCA